MPHLNAELFAMVCRPAAAFAAGLGLTLFCPGAAGAQDLADSTAWRADSVAIAAAIEEIQRDSLSEHQRALDAARSSLTRSVAFTKGVTALTPEAIQLLDTKGWYLWLNPGLTLRISGHADPGLGAEAALVQSRARIDAVRGRLRSRGVDLERIQVEEEGARPVPPTGGGEVSFTVVGELSEVEVPPASASPPPEQTVSTAIEPSGHSRYRWGVVRIFYATDRQRTGDGAVERFYGGDQTPDGSLEFGRIEVSVPRVHRPGVVEQPVWYRLERSTDPNKHMLVRSIEPLGQPATLDSLRQIVARSNGQEALLFIHGYNVTFHEAALRTAQLTYDLGFKGPPILYSWPSKGSLFRYGADRESAEWSAAHLRVFLDSIIAITGAKHVNVIAHSMGNLVLTQALEKMAATGGDTVLANVVLAAPDVPAALFQQQMASLIRPLVSRLTIYLSAKDKALWASKALSTHLRLGEATHPMLVIPQMDMIDATEVPTDLLGHGYIASTQDLLDDLVLLIQQKKAPPRGKLRSAVAAGGSYWKLP